MLQHLWTSVVCETHSKIYSFLAKRIDHVQSKNLKNLVSPIFNQWLKINSKQVVIAATCYFSEQLSDKTFNLYMQLRNRLVDGTGIHQSAPAQPDSVQESIMTLNILHM